MGVGAAAWARTGPICICSAGNHCAQLKGLAVWGAASIKPPAPCWCGQLVRFGSQEGSSIGAARRLFSLGSLSLLLTHQWGNDSV